MSSWVPSGKSNKRTHYSITNTRIISSMSSSRARHHLLVRFRTYNGGVCSINKPSLKSL